MATIEEKDAAVRKYLGHGRNGYVVFVHPSGRVERRVVQSILSMAGNPVDTPGPWEYMGERDEIARELVR